MNKYLFLILTMFLSLFLFAQTPKGAGFYGDMESSGTGHAVSMPDASTIAISTIELHGNNSLHIGYIRVYTWNIGSAVWVQKGADIAGEAANDLSGSSISMPDANTVAIGAIANDGNGLNAGHVRIYSWDGTSWVQKGADIDGEAAGDESGHTVSMPDANTIAIGAPLNAGNGSFAGHVRIYSWNGTSWVQKGADIDGELANDLSGSSISMPDANTVAIGAPNNDGNSSNMGQVRVYIWNGTAWVQRGADIDGQAVGDNFGHALSMPDASTVAIGAIGNDGNGSDAGQVRVYTWNSASGTWIRKGTPIGGIAEDQAGYAVSMPDANTVAIGAIGNDSNGSDAGHIRVYSWSGTIWVQRGVDIDGQASGDWFGWSVSMPDANTVAIGAPNNDSSASDAGHVSVYDLSGVTAVVETNTLPNLQAYPNPNSGQLNIDLGETLSVEIRVYNSLGQLLKEQQYNNQNLIALDLEGAAGIYFVEIVAADGASSRLKVTKR